MLSCYSIVFWLSLYYTNLKCTCTGLHKCTSKLARQIQRSKRCYTLIQVFFTVLNIAAIILYSLEHWCKYSLQSWTLMQVSFTVLNIDASIYSLEHWCKYSLQSWTLIQVSFTVLNIDASILYSLDLLFAKFWILFTQRLIYFKTWI